jgi:hypothetical protein
MSITRSKNVNRNVSASVHDRRAISKESLRSCVWPQLWHPRS